MTDAAPAQMPAQYCGNCAFIDWAGPERFYGRSPILDTDGVQIGYCRRAVPRPSVVVGYPANRKNYLLGVDWPEVRALDWCGDWKTPTGP